MFSLSLSQVQSNSNGQVSFEQFFNVIKSFGVNIRDSEIQNVFNYYSSNSSLLSIDDFVEKIKGEFSSFRRLCVDEAYDRIDTENAGQIDIEHFFMCFNAKSSPDVKSQRKSEDEVLKNFIDTFELFCNYKGIRPGTPVTRDMFMEFYSFESLGVESDNAFRLALASIWKKPDAGKYSWEKGQIEAVNKYPNANGNNLQASALVQSSRHEVESLKTPHNSENQDFDYQIAQQKSEQESFHKSHSVQSEFQNIPSISIPDILKKIHSKLTIRGCRGLLGLLRQFKIMDYDLDGYLSPQELAKSFHDYKIVLNEDEFLALFSAFDPEKESKLSYGELFAGILGIIPEGRIVHMENVFSRIDRQGTGNVKMNDLKAVFTGSNHPEVRLGNKTQDEIVGEFLEAFELHHSLTSGVRSPYVSKDEFISFYSIISSCIEDDEYFNALINSSFSVPVYNVSPQKKEKIIPPPQNVTIEKGHMFQNYKAPFGVSNEKVDYTTNLRPTTSHLKASENHGPAGRPTFPKEKSETQDIFARFRSRLAQRGPKGFMLFERWLQDYSSEDTICAANLSIISKALRLGDSGNVEGPIKEIASKVRGSPSLFRKRLIQNVFKRLDKDGDELISIPELFSLYNPKSHPEVRLGKRNEEEIMGEFFDGLDSFLGGNKQVSIDVFSAYFEYLSSCIDDDRTFESLIKGVFGL